MSSALLLKLPALYAHLVFPPLAQYKAASHSPPDVTLLGFAPWVSSAMVHVCTYGAVAGKKK